MAERTSHRVRNVVAAAGAGYVGIAFVLPVAAALLAAGFGGFPLLNLVHVAGGVLWIGAGVYVGVVMGPALQSMEPELRGRINVALIPRTTVLFVGVALASLLTGPMMAVRLGRWTLDAPLIVASVVAGLALFVVAIYLVRVQVLAYDELTGGGPPDPERMGALGARIGRASPIMLSLQFVVLVLMALVRASPF